MGKKSKDKDQKVIWGECSCRNCGGEDLQHLADMPRTENHVITDDGRRYTSVIREKVQCRECGSVTNLMKFEYDPSVWVE